MNKPAPFADRSFVLHVRTTSAAMLQVTAQIQAGIGVMARPESDGTWTVFIHGGYDGLQRVLSDSDIIG